MIEKSLGDATKAELEAELQLYLEAGAISADEIKALTNNASRAGVIEAFRTSVGIPRTLSAEDMKLNPDFAEQGLKEGDVVVLPPEKDETPEEKVARETEEKRIEDERVAKEAADKLEAEEKAKAGAPSRKFGGAVPARSLSEKRRIASQTEGGMAVATPKALTEPLFFKGKQVVTHSTAVHHGRLYHDIATHEATYRLTTAEFNEQVSK